MRTLACLAVLAAVAAAQETTYPIKLHRPTEVGARYAVTTKVTATNASVLRNSGRVANRESEEITVEFHGVFEVRAVNEKGGASEYLCFVRRLLVTKDGVTTQPLAAGDRFTAKAEGEETVYSMADREIPEELEEALSLVADADTGGPTDDESFGSKEPRALGDTWSGNAAKIAESLRRASLVTEKEKVESTVRLEGQETRWKVPCLRTLMTVSATDARPPASDTPADFSYTAGTLRASLIDVRPADAALGHTQQTMKLEVTSKIKGTGDRARLEIETRITIDQAEERIRLR